MSKPPYCPILTIGFDPPKEGKRDNRLCKKDCAWYNMTEEKCTITVISENLEALSLSASDASDYLSDIALCTVAKEEDYDNFFGSPEEEEYYRKLAGKRT